ncbi:DOMON-like domain-containing protein [Acinetobacter qingfengensis]|uniref:Uncharacterized protein n=1 Tax=Acinetobacter qingfengensis TaxID=1262585 RepID=A0A1E7REI4_9GAMM|nr:DOMON-like domain-containing protein [Acinetobacter qingfengensis]KAA8731141.1 DOMON-like domain-containing protein [Acinetobacter qingfengensis]OEY97810.1 hypothetical protein BJI46_07880 [Acinetobacter qingfengensis]
MASFELTAFQATRDIQLIGAMETPTNTIIQVGFWVNDPEQKIVWREKLAGHPRCDFLWEHTCFEIFIGFAQQDQYREINLSPTLAWQAYQFEEYRYPEQIPPLTATDIELVDLQRTNFGLTATLDLSQLLNHDQIKLQDLYFGLSAVINTAQQQHFFAMQHSSPQPDFHNKRDWLHRL